MFAITIVPMMFAGAMAIEYTHTLLQRDKAQNAADALLLRAATAPITSPLNPKYAGSGGKTPQQLYADWQTAMATEYKASLTKLGVNDVSQNSTPRVTYNPYQNLISLDYMIKKESRLPKILSPDNPEAKTEGIYIVSQTKRVSMIRSRSRSSSTSQAR
jgi:Flp pilus assembly protein TadG